MIIKCNCTHKSQDKIHGKGKIVFNKTRIKSEDLTAYRCTVCGNIVYK